MSTNFGTAQGAGQISTSNDVVLVIEFHARSDNAQSAYVGDSTVSEENGREVPPGESFVLNYALPDIGRHAGRALLSSFYVQLSGGDRLDWTAIVRDPAS